MNKRILIVGSLNMDSVIEMEQMPVIGETVLGSSLTYIPGGKGANQACAIARLGGDVKMLGCVGKDELGEIQKQKLCECGVDISGIKCGSNSTGMASIYVDRQGSNSIVVVPGANKECDITYLQEYDEAFQECEYIILQMEIPIETVQYAVDRGRELGKTIILNPAPAPGILQEELLAKLDYITPNEAELMTLSGISGNSVEDFIKGSNSLLEKGVKNVLVTLGEKGALLVNKDGAKIFPSRKVVSVDTTAAGDCFNGALAVALSEGKDNAGAIVFANVASSIAVTRNGAQTSLPDREETDRVLMEWEGSLPKTLFE